MSVNKPSLIEQQAREAQAESFNFALRQFNESMVRGYILCLLSDEIRKEYSTVDQLQQDQLSKLQGKIVTLKWLHSIVEDNFKTQPKPYEHK